MLPQLLAGCEELERLFDTVDKLEGFVDRVAGCSNELAARARVLHGAFEKRYPTSVKRMMRSLAFMVRSRRTPPAALQLTDARARRLYLCPPGLERGLDRADRDTRVGPVHRNLFQRRVLRRAPISGSGGGCSSRVSAQTVVRDTPVTSV